MALEPADGQSLNVNTQSPTLHELAAALAKAQSEMQDAARDAVNVYYRSKYPTLSSIWAACRPALSSHGLSVAQLPLIHGRKMLLETKLIHASGEWLSSFYPVAPLHCSPQALGSALTYAPRYALASMVGVAPDDDDAELAMNRNPRQQSADRRPSTGHSAKALQSRNLLDERRHPIGVTHQTERSDRERRSMPST